MAAFPENDGFSAAMGPRARLPRAVGEVCLHEIHELRTTQPCATLGARKLLGADAEVGQSVNSHGTASNSSCIYPWCAKDSSIQHCAEQGWGETYMYSTDRDIKHSPSRMPKKATAIKLRELRFNDWL
jgi:hypothetical protein